jgi:hypothetical protein
MELTAEAFLREKLESEISLFGDGTTEFHTRDINHLLKCLDDKDQRISALREERGKLISEINFDVKKQFKELLTLCMTVNNASAEERLGYIRRQYKEIWASSRE